MLVVHDAEKDIEHAPERAPPNPAMGLLSKKSCAWPSGVVGTKRGLSKPKAIHNSSPGELGQHAVRAAEVVRELVNAHVWGLDAKDN